MKVVSKADSSANGTCQKPEFASNFENILASDNCPRVYSTEGISCRSRRTLSFNFVKSTQILTSSFFGTTTIGAHQSVGCSTLTITPASSILLSSFFVLSISGKATRLGTLLAKGWASSLRSIVSTCYLGGLRVRPLRDVGNVGVGERTGIGE